MASGRAEDNRVLCWTHKQTKNNRDKLAKHSSGWLHHRSAAVTGLQPTLSFCHRSSILPCR